MMPEEYKISLIVEGYNSSTTEIWVLGKKWLDQPRKTYELIVRRDNKEKWHKPMNPLEYYKKVNIGPNQKTILQSGYI